jgi:hypothetical protein
MHTHDFEHLPGTERVLMLHIPTRTTFEIVYDPDQAMLGGLTIHGFAARIVGVTDNGEPPTIHRNLPPSAMRLSSHFSVMSVCFSDWPRFKPPPA